MPSGRHGQAVTGGGGSRTHRLGRELYGWGGGTQRAARGQHRQRMATTPLSLTSGPRRDADAPFRTTCTPATPLDPTGTSTPGALAWPVNSGTVPTGDGSPPVVVSLPPGSAAAEPRDRSRVSAGYAIVSRPAHGAPGDQPARAPRRSSRAESATSRPRRVGIPRRPCSGRSRPTEAPTTRPVSGGTSDTLTVASHDVAQNGDEYEAVFSNGNGPDATTKPAAVADRERRRCTVDHATARATRPVCPAQPPSFTATAGGVPAPRPCSGRSRPTAAPPSRPSWVARATP